MIDKIQCPWHSAKAEYRETSQGVEIHTCCGEFRAIIEDQVYEFNRKKMLQLLDCTVL